MLTRVTFVALLVTAALAGCTSDAPPADGTTTPPTGTTPTGGTGTTPTGGTGTTTPPTSGGNTTNPPANPAPVTASGQIAGPFEEEWAIPVPAVSPRAMTIQFNLTGAQPGAPVTASVFLVLKDPQGATVKSANLGLGGSGDKVDWAFSAADVTATGDYKLQATARSDLPQPVPSGGVANYQLTATVTY